MPRWRAVFFTFSFAVLASAPGAAQATGRWKLTIEGGGRPPSSGELVVSEKDGRLGGALLLESRDSAWISVSDLAFENGRLSFAAKVGEPLEVEARITGDGFTGTGSARGVRYRWSGTRLQDRQEYYPSLPRFLQRQVVIRPAEPHFRIPGRWLAAAAAKGETSQAARERYVQIALQAGLAPLPPESLVSAGLYRAMGLYHRQEMVSAAIQGLTRLHSSLDTDSARVRFDYLFRPAGNWLVDIHDVALARARRPFPTLTWESARPALTSAGLLAEPLPGIEVIPLAIYRLYALSISDQAAFRMVELRDREDPSAWAAVAGLLQGYQEAEGWYRSAMQFLLEHRWLPGGPRARSPVELVRAVWGGADSVPEIRTRVYGYPEGAVRIGVRGELLAHLLQAENASAGDWQTRHGAEELVETLHQLSLAFAGRTSADLGTVRYRLSSVGEYAAESFSGFLEPHDAILLDPSYQPLLALGTLLHEWQHLLHEGRRQASSRNGGFEFDGRQIKLHPSDPFLAEGLAEWLTEEILAPVLGEYPLLAFGEAEKRISLGGDDPHTLGYTLVRALAAELKDRTATRDLLVRHGHDPGAILLDPRLASAWSRYRGSDRLIPRRSGPVLLPQVVFQVEDGQPELVESVILGQP